MPFPITSYLVPATPDLRYLLEDVYLKGGYRVVETQQDRLDLHPDALKEGCLVYVSTAFLTYRYLGLGPQQQTVWEDASSDGIAGPRGPQGVQGIQGIQGEQGPSGEVGPKGERGFRGKPGLVDRGVWHHSIMYDSGDVVTYDGSAYSSIGDDNINHLPTDQLHWRLLVSRGGQGIPGPIGQVGPPGEQGPAGPPSLKARGNWLSIVMYETDDIVSWNGGAYISKSENNLNHAPSDSLYWGVFVAKGEQGDRGPQGEPGPAGGLVAHAQSHYHGGADALDPEQIGALPVTGGVVTGAVSVLQTLGWNNAYAALENLPDPGTCPGTTVFVFETGRNHISDGTAWQTIRSTRPGFISADVNLSFRKMEMPNTFLDGWVAARGIRLKQDLPGSQARCMVPPMQDVVLYIQADGVHVGNLTFRAGETSGTFGFSTDQYIEVGSTVTVSSSAQIDLIISNVCINITGFSESFELEFQP